jgi:hypothetical protein
VALIATACASRTVVVTRPPATSRANAGNTALTLGVPPGHLPPPGECRVWVPGRPRPRSCHGIAALAPAGSWILYRPGDDRRLVHVRYVDERRAGAVIRIRVFEAESGKYLRDERQ